MSRRLVALLALAASLSSPDGRLAPARAGAVESPRCGPPDGDVLIPAGAVLLGEDGATTPGRRVPVAAFRIDRHEVTNRQFAAFVQATAYVTDAERQGGGAVFAPPDHAVSLEDASRWWRLVRGASWRHPRGPASGIDGRMEEPVVQVTWADAQAYARWAGRALPDEAQWERAARATQAAPAAPLSWAYDDDGRPLANTWQGDFPVADAGADGYKGLAPVGCFRPNAFGLYDMIGNAWEWTTAARGGSGTRVVKGGSFLCSASYCANFRPAGWQAQEEDLPTSHIGFRTIALAQATDVAPHLDSSTN